MATVGGRGGTANVSVTAGNAAEFAADTSMVKGLGVSGARFTLAVATRDQGRMDGDGVADESKEGVAVSDGDTDGDTELLGVGDSGGVTLPDGDGVPV